MTKKDAPQTNITIAQRLSEFDKAAARIKELDKDIHLHLIKIQPNNKIPISGMSWKQINFSIDYAKDLINNGYNVAIVAHSDGLCFIDIDIEGGKFKLPEGTIIEMINDFDTLTIRTKSGGLQLYFVNSGITEYFTQHDYARNPKLFYNGLDCGEIRTDDAYVIFPGSFVPTTSDDKGSISTATGLYSVFHDAPIRKMSPDKLPEWLTFEQEKKKKIKTKAVPANLNIKDLEELAYGEYISEIGMTLEEVLERDTKLSELLSGPYGIDGKSRSEGDFGAAFRLDYWRFDDAQKASIIQRFRPYEKTYRLDYLDMTISKARSSTKYDADSAHILNTRITDIENVVSDTLPDELPDRKFILLRAPPRLGKTHWSIAQLIKHGTGVYVTHRHEIIRHALDIFETLEDRKTAVWLKGKLQCCNRKGGMNCDLCEKKPIYSVEEGEAGVTLGKLDVEAEKLLRDRRILVPEDVPDTLCPYYVTHIAEKHADFCFTIPYFLKNVDQVRGVKQRRALLVVDEDPTCSEFYPPSVEVASYMHIGGGAIRVDNAILEYKDTVMSIQEHILGKKRKPRVDKNILSIFEKYHAIVGEISSLVDAPGSAKFVEVSTKIRELDVTNEFDQLERENIVKKLTEYEKEITKRDESMIGDALSPFIYVAKNPFVWVGRNPRSLHMVGDRVVFYRPYDYKKIIIIGTTEAELYIRDVCGDSYVDESVIIEINKFPFSENFAILKLVGTNRTEETRMMGSLIHSLGRQNDHHPTKVPALILSSSKRRQEALHRFLTDASVVSTSHGHQDQIMHWFHGKLNIFYTNSIISRGLDLPLYDIIFIDSCSFATPYWSAMREYCVESGDTKGAQMYSTIISKIIMDELTNCAFRHSPIRNMHGEDDDNLDQSKIIVIKRDDFRALNPTFIDGMKTKDIVGFSDLELAKLALTELAKKTSPDVVFDFLREMDFKPLSIVYLYWGKCEKKVGLKELKGKTKSEMKLFFDSEKCFSLDSQKKDAVSPEIHKTVVSYPLLVKNKRVSAKALIDWVFDRLDHKVHRKTIENSLEMMSLTGVLRTELREMDTAAAKRPKRTSKDPVLAEGDMRKTHNLRKMYRLAETYLAEILEEKRNNDKTTG